MHALLDVGAGAWIAPRLTRAWDAVTSLVPSGYDAYVRVPHPADDDGERRIGELDPASLSALCAVLREHTTRAGDCVFALWDGYGWMHGGGAVFVAVASDDGAPPAVPDRMPPGLAAEQLAGPRLRHPHRDYVLFAGRLDEIGELGWRVPVGDWFQPQSPNLFWPADRSWCVATEIDLAHTLVACDAACARALVADGTLGATRIDPDAAVAWFG